MLHVYLFLLSLPLLFFLDPLYRKLISFLPGAAATILTSKDNTDVDGVSSTNCESSNGGSVDVDVDILSSSRADHLVIMVHGIPGCAANWKYVANQFVQTLPGKVMVHCKLRSTSH